MLGGLARRLFRVLRGHRYVSEFDVPALLQVRKTILVIIYNDTKFVDISDTLKEFFARNGISYSYKWVRGWAPQLAFGSQEHLDAYVEMVHAMERHYTVNGTAKVAVKDWLAENNILHVWEQRLRAMSSFHGDFNPGRSVSPYIEGDLHLLSDAAAVEMALLFNVHRKEWAERKPELTAKHFFVGLPH